MKRSEAYHILDKMWENATAEQAEALSIAQNDIEFVDLMPEDMVAVVRCKDCKCGKYPDSTKLVGKCVYCALYDPMPLMRCDDFCSYGERRADNGK